MTPVRLEPVAPRSQVKHSTTEPLRSQEIFKEAMHLNNGICIQVFHHQIFNGKQCFKTKFAAVNLMLRQHMRNQRAIGNLEVLAVRYCSFFRKKMPESWNNPV